MKPKDFNEARSLIVAEAYDKLSRADQEVIDRQVVRLTRNVIRLGEAGACELLYVLGSFLNQEGSLKDEREK